MFGLFGGDTEITVFRTQLIVVQCYIISDIIIAEISGLSDEEFDWYNTQANATVSPVTFSYISRNQTIFNHISLAICVFS